MSKIDEYGMEKFGTLDSCENTIAILEIDGGDERRNSKGIRQAKSFYVIHNT